MTSALVQSLRYNFDHALGQLESALNDCPDGLWEQDLWPDEAPTQRQEDGALRGSSPWILGHHAMICMDYDLTGEFSAWEPPPPIRDFLLYADATRVFTKPELLDYLGHCQEHVRETLDSLTDEAALQPLPDRHRYRGMLFGVLLGSIPPHVVEHAAQIHQFLRAASDKP